METFFPEALVLHRRAIICDAHCDTISALEHGGRSFGERSTQGHVDLPRLLEGGVTAQVFAMYVDNVYYLSLIHISEPTRPY